MLDLQLVWSRNIVNFLGNLGIHKLSTGDCCKPGWENVSFSHGKYCCYQILSEVHLSACKYSKYMWCPLVVDNTEQSQISSTGLSIPAGWALSFTELTVRDDSKWLHHDIFFLYFCCFWAWVNFHAEWKSNEDRGIPVFTGRTYAKAHPFIFLLLLLLPDSCLFFPPWTYFLVLTVKSHWSISLLYGVNVTLAPTICLIHGQCTVRWTESYVGPDSFFLLVCLLLRCVLINLWLHWQQ